MNSQLLALQAELDRLGDENRKLRSMLDHLMKNYNDLQNQLLLAMQQQARKAAEDGQVLMLFITYFFPFFVFLIFFRLISKFILLIQLTNN